MKFLAIEPNQIVQPHKPIDRQITEATAFIPVYGCLTHHAVDSWEETTSYDEIRMLLREALSDGSIDRIVLDIDSPGGEVNGLFDLCDFIYQARSEKPIIAWVNDNAFSAAYAIASSANTVIGSRTSGMGSIGVIATHCDISEYDQKEGFKVTSIFAGSRKNDMTPHEPLSPEALQATQKEVDRLYEIFVATVARNRNLTEEQVKNTQASLFFGENAITAGLADTLGRYEYWQDFSLQPTRSFIMTEQELPEIEPTTSAEEVSQPISEDENTPEYSVPEAISALVTLAKITNRQDKLASWIERHMTVAQVQEELLNEMEHQPVISSHHAQKAPENPMLQAAKKRI